MNLKPVYKFEWENGRTRRTDNLENAADAREGAIEELAAWGRADDECAVTLVGHETI